MSTGVRQSPSDIRSSLVQLQRGCSSVYHSPSDIITVCLRQIQKLLKNTIAKRYGRPVKSRYTKYSRHSQLKAHIEHIRQRYKPLYFVQPDCHPALHAVPLLTYYGVAVTKDELHDYAMRIELHPPPSYDGKPEPLRRLWSVEAAVKYMSMKFKFQLHLRVPLSVDYHWNVALYSNYVADVEKLIDNDEARLVRLILREIRLPEGRGALWHYDTQSGSIEMRCWTWKLPSKETRDEIREAYAELGVTL